MFSAPAMRERGATLLKMVRDNTPFMNLWATSLAMNTLVWHRLQEWISPGYLQRAERRQQDLQGTQFLVFAGEDRSMGDRQAGVAVPLIS